MNDIHQIQDLNGVAHDIKDYRIPALPSDPRQFLNGNGAWASMINLVYPIGSIYMSTQNTSPANLFGGTWQALENRFLVGAGDTYTAGITGGEAEHTLTESELPQVTEHMSLRNLYNSSNDSIMGPMAQTDTDGTVNPNYSLTFNAATVAGTHTSTTATQYTFAFGGGEAHNNLPPYLPVYMWERTA